MKYEKKNIFDFYSLRTSEHLKITFATVKQVTRETSNRAL